VRFVLLGTGTLVPDADRGPAGFLVEDGATRILVDGGSGTLQRLARHGVDARDLDGGVYSHRHLDHCGDLAPLLFTLRVGADRPRRRDYPLWGGEGLREFLTGLRDVYGHWIASDHFDVPVVELPLDGPGHAELPGGVRLDTLPARHSAGALHLRFTGTDGFTVVFSGDTGPNENLARLSDGVDLLVSECAAVERDPWDSHLSPDDVAAIVDAARPRRVVLTHFYPGCDREAARKTVARCGVPVEIGVDGQVVGG
jgi:ribonuclease BN (tRNA processing enzyme)